MNNPSTHNSPQLTFSVEPMDTVPPVTPLPEKPPVATVSELTRRLRGHIENTFCDVWVRGEITGFRKPVSGHGYFCIKDANAQLRAVMFRPVLSKVKFQLKDGMEVHLHGAVTVYEARGEYQLVCDRVEPVGVGALQLAFEQMKERLQKEGLFEAKHKKALPFLPKRIGVITSLTGAAVRDIIKVLSSRFPKREILIFPASVQGEKAAPEICAALAQAERWNTENPQRALEVLIVGRGGGSLEDLWCFNEEAVARAIFNCQIPIISAVGHEIDFTIADFVADVRAATPSAAAEMVLPRSEDLTRWVQQLQTRLATALRKHIQQDRLHLTHLSQRLVDPRERLKRYREDIKALTHRARSAMNHKLTICQNYLKSRAQLLDSLSPFKVISRGYTLTQLPTGAILRSTNQLQPGDELITQTTDGKIHSTVIKTTSL